MALTAHLPLSWPGIDDSLSELLVVGALRAGWDLIIDSDQPLRWDVLLELQLRPGLGGDVALLRVVQPPLSSDRPTERGAISELDLLAERLLGSITDAIRVWPAQHVFGAIERLTSIALAALADDRSTLRRELDAAQIRIAFLEGQLAALSEARATGRRGIIRAVLASVAAILLAATTGVAEAATISALQSEPQEVTAAQLAEECRHLLELAGQLPEAAPRPSDPR